MAKKLHENVEEAYICAFDDFIKRNYPEFEDVYLIPFKDTLYLSLNVSVEHNTIYALKQIISVADSLISEYQEGFTTNELNSLGHDIW